MKAVLFVHGIKWYLQRFYWPWNISNAMHCVLILSKVVLSYHGSYIAGRSDNSSVQKQTQKQKDYVNQLCVSKTENKLCGLSPQGNYTDQATASCRRVMCIRSCKIHFTVSKGLNCTSQLSYYVVNFFPHYSIYVRSLVMQSVQRLSLKGQEFSLCRSAHLWGSLSLLYNENQRLFN
jgi:hypothetical protein